MKQPNVTLPIEELDELLDSIVHTAPDTDGEGSKCGACGGFGWGIVKHSPTCLWLRLRKQYFPDHRSLKFAEVRKS